MSALFHSHSYPKSLNFKVISFEDYQLNKAINVKLHPTFSMLSNLSCFASMSHDSHFLGQLSFSLTSKLGGTSQHLHFKTLF